MLRAKNSSRLLIIMLMLAFATSLVLALSYTNDTGADLDEEIEEQSVLVTDEGLVTNITVTVEFLKTDGTCAAPASDFAFHRETVFSLRSPSGTVVNLVSEDTYTGGDDLGTLIVTFDDAALTPVGGVPASGTFQPVEPLSTFIDEVAAGTWTLIMEDTVALDPLCVFEWTLNVEAVPPNTPPVAEDFTIEIIEDEVASFSFLDYVSDAEGDPLTIEALTEPSNGTLVIADDASATYTPEEEWAGVVSFDYVANDGQLDSNIAVVHIIVLPVNDAPNCDGAVLNPPVLWPPNHREVSFELDGIIDVDSLIVTIELTEITSNEPLNGTGDGNTDQDWSIDDAWVRAERSGNGNGRIYSIAFTADDEDWIGTFVDPENFVDPDPEPIDEEPCEGTGVIVVPHDQRNGSSNLAAILAAITGDDAGSDVPVITDAANIVSNPPAPTNNGNGNSNGNSNNGNNGNGKGN